MAKPKEPEPTRGTKIRAGLPGEEWRKHISAGAERVYDTALVPQRNEAKALRKKGRLIAAHQREKGAYKIRARGYERRKRGLAPVEKGLTREVRRIGPYTKEKVRFSFKDPKPTKWDRANDTIKATGQALGPFRTVAALGGGAGIAATVKEKSDRAKVQAKKIVTGKSPDTESKVVGKSLTIDDINDRYLPVTYRRMDIDTINKAWSDDDYEAYLDDLIEKMSLAGLGKWGNQIGTSISRGYQKGGIQGAFESGQKYWQRTGGLSHLNRMSAGGAANPSRIGPNPSGGIVDAWKNKGGLSNMSRGQKAAVGAGAGALGLGALGYGAYRFAKPRVATAIQGAKSKAKKYAIYGAAGLGGTAALGGYMGSRAGG